MCAFREIFLRTQPIFFRTSPCFAPLSSPPLRDIERSEVGSERWWAGREGRRSRASRRRQSLLFACRLSIKRQSCSRSTRLARSARHNCTVTVCRFGARMGLEGGQVRGGGARAWSGTVAFARRAGPDGRILDSGAVIAKVLSAARTLLEARAADEPSAVETQPRWTRLRR
jgi:hypothetical protein